MAKYRTIDTDTPNEVNKILNRHIELIDGLRKDLDDLVEVISTPKPEPAKPKAKDKK